MTVYVRGVGAWMTGRPTVAAVLGDDPPDPRAQRPACDGISSRLLRGSSLLTRMSVDVAMQAIADADVHPSTVSSVFSSTFGEIQIAIDQLEMMDTDDGQISPVAFKNSVHNTAAGVFSIAAGNHEPATAIAAGPCSVAYALLEAELLLADGAPAVVVVTGDEAVPAVLGATPSVPFAAAFALSAEPRPTVGVRVELRGLAQGRSTGIKASVPAALQSHPAAPAHTLLRSITNGATTTVVLGEEDGDCWAVDVCTSS